MQYPIKIDPCIVRTSPVRTIIQSPFNNTPDPYRVGTIAFIPRIGIADSQGINCHPNPNRNILHQQICENLNPPNHEHDLHSRVLRDCNEHNQYDDLNPLHHEYNVPKTDVAISLPPCVYSLMPPLGWVIQIAQHTSLKNTVS